MKLWEYEGKNVKVTTKEGQTFEGKAYDYTAALDNTPEIASISIGHTELFENEIQSVQLI